MVKIFVQHSTTEIVEEIGLTLGYTEEEVFGNAGKFILSKETTGIVNNGNPQVELKYPVKDIGPRLVMQAASTNNFTATSVVLGQGLTAEGDKVAAAGEIHLQITGGTENTANANALVAELKLMSKEVKYSELTDVASVRSRNNLEVGAVLPETLSRVERNGVDWLYAGGGTQFGGGYNYLYFTMNTDKLLIAEKKATNARDLVSVLEVAIRGDNPVWVGCEGIEQEALATLGVNKLGGSLKITALNVPGFGERKSQYLEDFATLTDTVLMEEFGFTMDKAETEVLGQTGRVGDGRTQKAVNKGVAQIQNLIEAAEQVYNKEKLNERIVMLSVGVVQIEAGAHSETDLKGMKLRVEDALNATKVLSSDNPIYGYNAANGIHEDLMTSEIVDLTKEKSQASASCATSGQ